MVDILKGADAWFVNFIVIVLGCYFVWSVRGILKDLKDSIKDLKTVIKELFEDRNKHEVRIIALETKCAYMHGDNGPGVYEYPRHAGRRALDPQPCEVDTHA